MSNEKTTGQQILEHWATGVKHEDDVAEYAREMSKSLPRAIEQGIQTGLKAEIYTNKDFYLEIVLRTEMRVVVKPYVFLRSTAPTPACNQHVFKFHRKSSTLSYLWSIPESITYDYILKNLPKLLQDKETRQIASFCMSKASGELLKQVMIENKETKPGYALIRKGEEN